MLNTRPVSKRNMKFRSSHYNIKRRHMRSVRWHGALSLFPVNKYFKFYCTFHWIFKLCISLPPPSNLTRYTNECRANKLKSKSPYAAISNILKLERTSCCTLVPYQTSSYIALNLVISSAELGQ